MGVTDGIMGQSNKLVSISCFFFFLCKKHVKFKPQKPNMFVFFCIFSQEECKSNFSRKLLDLIVHGLYLFPDNPGYILCRLRLRSSAWVSKLLSVLAHNHGFWHKASCRDKGNARQCLADNIFPIECTHALK